MYSPEKKLFFIQEKNIFYIRPGETENLRKSKKKFGKKNIFFYSSRRIKS